ncbi:MAG: FHA domain-containing protein, partial [Chloroflexi bacterium]|nr:FHA domain-containing protein [Chloroflexota bacterium]
MPYGRIDVYWPDGPIESYQLNKPAIAIGRSTGNDIVLDTTAISRYHITFSVKDQAVYLEDLQSVNGTYVDGVRIPPNDPFPLRGGEEIQIGDIRLIFQSSADLTSDFGDTTQRIVLSQLTYRVEMEAPDMRVAPGAHVQAVLKIENLGDEMDRYFVELEGLPKTWVRIDRLELEVDPGDTAQVIISFKPLRRSESAPGEYPFMVRVRSRSNPAQTIDVPSTLRVLPFSGFGMALVPLSSPDGRFTLYVHNQGNAPLPLVLRGTDTARRLQFDLP